MLPFLFLFFISKVSLINFVLTWGIASIDYRFTHTGTVTSRMPEISLYTGFPSTLSITCAPNSTYLSIWFQNLSKPAICLVHMGSDRVVHCISYLTSLNLKFTKRTPFLLNLQVLLYYVGLVVSPIVHVPSNLCWSCFFIFVIRIGAQ